MIILKIVLLIGLFLTDLIILYAGSKYSASHGNPSVVEKAKKQLQISSIANLWIVLTLIGIHVFEGIDLLTYTTFEWILLSITGMSTLLIVGLVGVRFVTQNKNTKFDDILFTVGAISFLVAVCSFHAFLGFIQF